jgi:hypothetical protein
MLYGSPEGKCVCENAGINSLFHTVPTRPQKPPVDLQLKREHFVSDPESKHWQNYLFGKKYLSAIFKINTNKISNIFPCAQFWRLLFSYSLSIAYLLNFMIKEN